MHSIKIMPPDARLWVYQSNRALSASEINSIKEEGKIFIDDWSAHGAALRAAFEILYDRFIVIAVDEKQAMASGCSIDKSVHFIKELEKKYAINFFDRMQVAYKKEGKILASSYAEFEKLAERKMIDKNTIVFNNMVSSKSAFEKEWEVPLKDSWQSRVLK